MTMPTDETTVTTDPPIAESFGTNLCALRATLIESSEFTTPYIFMEELRRRGVRHPGIIAHEVFRLVDLASAHGLENMRRQLLMRSVTDHSAFVAASAGTTECYLLADQFWFGCLGGTGEGISTTETKSILRVFLRSKYTLAVLQERLRADDGEIPESPEWDRLYEAARLFSAVVVSPAWPRGTASAASLLREQQDRNFRFVYGYMFDELAEGFECNCGNYDVQDNGQSHNGEWWCESCAEELNTCSTCMETEWAEDMHMDPSECYICAYCYERHVSHCGNCETAVWTEDFGNECPACGYHGGSGSGEFGSLEMYSYSYKPEPRFHRWDGTQIHTSWERNPHDDPDHDRIYMGVEMETNVPGERDKKRGGGTVIAQSVLMSDYGFLYAKSDCTVSGPELVSHPATLAAHRQLWDLFPWRELVFDHGWSGWRGSNAGIHIHIDRKAFTSRAHLARFQMLFGSWREEVVAFAGRNCGSYGYFGSDMERNAVAYAKGDRCPPRGSAINYLNRNTVEVRVFRSSLRKNTLLAYLEFLHGLVTYAGQKRSFHIANENAADSEVFFDWLKADSNYQLAATRFAERTN
jgi:hypothetical protein